MKAVRLIVHTRSGTRLAGTSEAMADEMRLGLMQLLANLKMASSLAVTDDKGVTRYIHPDAIEHIELHERDAKPDEERAAQEAYDALKAHQRLAVARTVPNGGQTQRTSRSN